MCNMLELLIALLLISIDPFQILAASILPAYTDEHCYMSLANHRINFKLHSFFKNGPDYLRAKVIFNLIPWESRLKPINLESELHFIKVINGPCHSNFEISPKNIEHGSWSVSIHLYTGYVDQPLAKFIYSFDYTYKFNMDLLYDQSAYFGMTVDIKQNAAEHIPIDSFIPKLRILQFLRALHSTHDGICFTTPNNRALVIKPTYTYGDPEYGYITQFSLEYQHHTGTKMKVSYPAFGCKVGDSDVQRVLAVLDNRVNQGDVRLQVYAQKYDKLGMFVLPITLQNAEFVQIDRLSDEHIGVRFFLIQPVIDIDYRENGNKVQIYQTEDGNRYFALERIAVDKYEGVNNIVWFSTQFHEVST